MCLLFFWVKHSFHISWLPVAAAGGAVVVSVVLVVGVAVVYSVMESTAQIASYGTKLSFKYSLTGIMNCLVFLCLLLKFETVPT